MPYSDSEKKLMSGLIKQYGAAKAIGVYHAMLNGRKHDKLFSKETLEKRDKKSKH